MTTEELLSNLEPGNTLLARNDPFDYRGKAEITLDGGDRVYWLFGDEGAFLSVNPQTDEIMIFTPAEGEVEEEEDIVSYFNDSYELSYEDHGEMTSVEEIISGEEGNQFHFRDFEDEEGRVIRLLENESTNEENAYAGSVLLEEDLTLVEE